MFAKLSALVSSSPAFPYVVGEAFEDTWGSGWTHARGTVKEDGTPVSVFKVSSNNKNDRTLQAARNGAKRLKMVRHPNILALKDTMEVEDKGLTTLYIITEPVTPLAEILKEREIEGAARDEYIAMGLFHVAKAVAFLNNDCKLIHGNVCMRAVGVTPTLDWRLHGFDLLSEHQPATGVEWPLMNAAWMVGAQYKPAELGKADWAAVQQGPPWAVDAWGLGCLMQEAYSGQALTRTEELRNTGPLPKAILPDYQRLLASQPSRRLNPTKLAESAALKTKLVDAISFMESLAVKDSNEKDLFFKRLPAVIPTLPPPVARRKLLPMLASALEFGGAPSVALGALLQIGKTLDEESFTAQVVPALSKLFASNDRTIRRSLLESVDTYGQHFSQATVETQVYPHVATGFGDSNAYLRELTLKSMLVLAPKLSQKTLNQSLLKFLAKLQVDEEPGIRANTTILLGNLASHLSEAACKRVLLNAFTRALRDAFPPARIAGVKAMVATAARHSPDDIALRALPALGPLTIDPVAEVRHVSLSALQTFTRTLMEHSRHLDEVAAAAPSGEGVPGGTSAAAAQAGTVAWGANLGNSGLGWAMSSMGLSRGGAAASTTGTIGGAPSPSSNGPAAPAAATVRPGTDTSAASPRPPSHHADMSGQPASRTGGGGQGSQEGEGWDDDEGFDALEDDPHEAEAAERLRRLNMRSGGGAAARTGSVASASGRGGANGGPARQGSLDSDTSLASGFSHTSSHLTSGSAVDLPAMAPAEQARKAHVSLPSGARGRGRSGLRPARGGSSAGGRGGAMKLGATKAGASKLGNPEEFFDF